MNKDPIVYCFEHQHARGRGAVSPCATHDSTGTVTGRLSLLSIHLQQSTQEDIARKASKQRQILGGGEKKNMFK